MGHFDKRKTWHLILHTLYQADRATHYLQYLQKKKEKKVKKNQEMFRKKLWKFRIFRKLVVPT